MTWPKVNIDTPDGNVTAIAPFIVSASRSTDIPAFYSEWLLQRFRAGYSKWINPFNRRPQYISFSNTKVVVFWSKNPEKLLNKLHFFDERSIKYYFQFTLNDYENEGFEPNVPSLAKRISTFKQLSDMIGPDRVIWRFDPLMITKITTTDRLIEKVFNVGNQIHNYTKKLVFSFVDIVEYKKVFNNLNRLGIEFDHFNNDDIEHIASSIQSFNSEWNLDLATCGETVDLSGHGISHNKCIDDCLIGKLFGNTNMINDFASNQPMLPGICSKFVKDPGQRKECGCIISKDIGQYNTCPHMCVYCYANTSEKVVNKNIASMKNGKDTIV